MGLVLLCHPKRRPGTKHEEYRWCFFLFNRGYFILSKATTGNIPSEFLLLQDNLELDPESRIARPRDQVSAIIPSSQENNVPYT
jgi:hypothetical protein